MIEKSEFVFHCWRSINCYRSLQFLKTNISQGIAATCFKCGVNFNHRFIANVLLNVTVKK